MQTIGERLEEARKKKGISIREAAEATKIRGDYLQKFESNQFDIGLTEIYTRGFLRTYSNFLKVPADRILSDYASLGRAEVRPRQPSREIYGRMDISVASAEAGGAAAAEPPPEPSPANRGPQRSRAATSLPSGPDPAVVFKYVKWAGVAVILILAVLLIKAMFFGGRPAPSGSGATNPPTVRGPYIGFIALRAARVIVQRENPDTTAGEVIFTRAMAAGESHTMPWTGAMFIEVEPPDAFDLDINGRRNNFSRLVVGNRGRLPGPPPQ